MSFILSALILCILAVHSFENGRYLIGAICLICSAFLPVLLQDYHDHINRTPTHCTADTHRGGNGYTPPLAEASPPSAGAEPVDTIALLDTMNADLEEIKADLLIMVNMSEELRMCLTSTPDPQP